MGREWKLSTEASSNTSGKDWSCSGDILKVQLLGHIGRLDVGEDEGERGVWDNSQISDLSDWVSDGATWQDEERRRRSKTCRKRW